MSDKHDLEKGSTSGDDLPELRRGNGPQRSLTTVTLTAEQFEMLYLQPRDNRRQYPLAATFGNPTALGISSFLVAHTPLAMDLMNFRGATPGSSVAMLGAFYACGGLGLYIACIMEWIIGNTFPSVIFGTFGGFFLSYAIINQPSMGIAASFADAASAGNSITATLAGQANPSYNVGLGLYFLCWGILCFIYLLCALRTNLAFVILFIAITCAFEFIAAGYFNFADGHVALALKQFKIAGGFAFISALGGFYINISLLFASVGYPFAVPLFDLSSRIMAPKAPKKEA